MPNNKKDLPAAADRVICGTENGKLSEMHGISKQRRKLIKASAATIPALMTLRSGAAAAVASSYQCLNHPNTTGAIDPILGDNADDLPHDQWVRVDAKPGKIIKYSKGSTTNIVYCIRKPGGSLDLVGGWDFYDDAGKYIKNLPTADANAIQDAWGTATTVYYVASAPSGFFCTSETGGVSGIVNCPVLPAFFMALVNNEQYISTVQVLAYVEFYPDGSVAAITHFPNQTDMAKPFTASCLCSIDPTFQMPV